MEQAFTSPDFTEACERIAERVLKFLPVRFSSIGVVDEQRALRVVAHAGVRMFGHDCMATRPTLTSGAGVTGRAVREERPCWTADVLHDPRVAAAYLGGGSTR